ncbi:hypothetical protein [Marinobacterium lutimaris]|nr:hypothetical protein [Marinobacterium lutimaris]
MVLSQAIISQGQEVIHNKAQQSLPLVAGTVKTLRFFADLCVRRYHSKGEFMSFEAMTDKEILDIANPIMDNLMDASTRIDHKAHTRDFTDRMKAIVTEEHLQKVCEQYQKEKGFFSARTPVAVFKRPDSAAIIWKQSFTKAKGEFVAEMVLVQQNGEYRCDHVMVF